VFLNIKPFGLVLISLIGYKADSGKSFAHVSGNHQSSGTMESLELISHQLREELQTRWK
jgi:hypothetical protein